MLRRLICAILLAGALASAPAQTGKATITLRILDGKTGQKVTPDNIQVRLKAHDKISNAWVKTDDDGNAQVAILEGTTAISFKATYDDSTSYYVNCDVARQKDTTVESWFPIADILSGGIKMPNDCVKGKDADKVNVDVKPGEFVLFVRKRNWRESVQD
jgi:hypothetical protein